MTASRAVLMTARKRPLGTLGICRSQQRFEFAIQHGSLYRLQDGSSFYSTVFRHHGRSRYEAGSCEVAVTGTHLWHPMNMLKEPVGYLDDEHSVQYSRSGWGYAVSAGSVKATVTLCGMNKVRIKARDQVLAEFPITPAIRLPKERNHDVDRLISAVLGSGLVHHVRFGADVLRGDLWVPPGLVDAVIPNSRRNALIRNSCFG